MGSVIQDLRIAARNIQRRPGFALGVALTLGLGIGATTTIYSVVDGVMLRPLPFEAPEELVAVGTTFPGREWEEGADGLQHLAGTSVANYVDLEERARSFQALAAVEQSSILFPDEGQGPELAAAARVSAEFFDVLSVSPALGRMFVPEEYHSGSEAVFLVTYGAWQRRLGGDPDVIGGSLNKVGLPATIIGVLPRDFAPPEALFSTVPDFWMPLQADHGRYASRGMRSVSIVGRLSAGTTVEEARTETTQIAAELARVFPDGNVYPDGSYFGIGVNGLHEETVGTTGRALLIFLGASVLLLMLAALNAATLLLARSLDRMRELGLRVALGAGRMRVTRLLLAEAGLLSALGGAIGVALAYGGVQTFLRLAPSSIPRTSMVAVDGRVLAVAAAISMTAGLAAGLLPALRLTSRAPWTRLQSAGRTVAQPGSRLRSALVGGQVALAVLLLSSAGLLFTSFMKIRAVEPGFEPEGLLSLRADLKRPGAPEGEHMWQGWDQVLAEVRAVPGVEAVAGTSNPPFQSPFWAPRLLLPGDPADLWREGISGYSISPGYLETVGTRLVKGRDIEVQDGPEAKLVALVNETFVRTQLNGADPIGLEVNHSERDATQSIRIVGVVEDVVQGRAEEGRRAAIYVPYTQTEWPFVQVVVRSQLPAEVLMPELRQAIARFNPVVPPRDMRTLEARMSASRTTPRFQAMLLGAFALVAMLLAAAGLYGSLSHAVGRRQRELGVRMALGAARSGVLWMVLRQGLGLSVVGFVLGIAAALGTTRILAGFLYEVEPTDPVTFGGVALVLLVVSVAACLVPARRATGVDPVNVLRAE